MDVGDSLRTFLLLDPTVAGLLAGAVGPNGMIGRIYPDELPQAPTYPAVRYTIISEQDQYHTKGPANLTRQRWQIDCFAPRKTDANTVARAIRDRLRGHKGAMGGHVAQGVFIENSRSSRETDTEPPLWFVSRDFIVWVED